MLMFPSNSSSINILARESPMPEPVDLNPREEELDPRTKG